MGGNALTGNQKILGHYSTPSSNDNGTQSAPLDRITKPRVNARLDVLNSGTVKQL
jgi:hypothetical protein